jgi:hypothetical protein
MKVAPDLMVLYAFDEHQRIKPERAVSNHGFLHSYGTIDEQRKRAFVRIRKKVSSGYYIGTLPLSITGANQPRTRTVVGSDFPIRPYARIERGGPVTILNLS